MYQHQEFLDAIGQNNLECAREYYSSYKELLVDYVLPDTGDNLFHLSAKHHFKEVFDLFQPSSEQLMMQNKKGFTPLEEALFRAHNCNDNNESNYLEIAKLLVPKSNYHRSLLLLLAIKKKNTQMAKYLLQHGVVMSEKKLMTSLELALATGNNELVETLAKCITTSILNNSTDDKFVMACLVYANQSSTKDICNDNFYPKFNDEKLNDGFALLKKHHLLHRPYICEESKIMMYGRFRDSVNQIRNDTTFITNEEKKENFAVVFLCLEEDYSLSDHLFYKATKYGFYSTLELLIATKQLPNPKENSFGDIKFPYKIEGLEPKVLNTFEYGFTYIVENNHLDCVNLLAEYVGDDKLLLNIAYNCLCIAAEMNHTDVAKVLLQHGANPNQAGISGESKTTPLYRAVKKENIQVTRVLLQHGADPNVKITITAFDKHQKESYPLIEYIFLGHLKEEHRFDREFNSPVLAELIKHSPCTLNHLKFSGYEAKGYTNNTLAKINFNAILKKISRPDEIKIYNHTNTEDNDSIFSDSIEKAKNFHQRYFREVLLSKTPEPLLVHNDRALFNLFLTCKKPHENFQGLATDIFWHMCTFLTGHNEFSSDHLKKIHGKFIEPMYYQSKPLIKEIHREFQSYINKSSLSKGHKLTGIQFMRAIETIKNPAELAEKFTTHLGTFKEENKVRGNISKAMNATLKFFSGKETEPKWDESRSSWDPNGDYYKLVKKCHEKISNYLSENTPTSSQLKN